jgi:hypothetical protein
MTINFSLSGPSKLKAYLINVNEKLNDDEKKKPFNDNFLLTLNKKDEYQHEPIVAKKEDLQNKRCNYIEIQKGINGVIYDYLYQNNYQIKIIPNNKNNLE